jgi:hypothetical protein
VHSVGGAISLSTLDLPTAGQDIDLGSTSLIQADGGAITLDAGDNVFAAAGSVIRASGVVTIAGNVGAADTVPTGVRIDLRGAITGSSALILGSAENDTISLTSVGGNTPTTIESGNGDDTILIGSAATAIPTASDAGGVLSGISGALTIVGGTGADVLEIDDSGDAYSRSGTLTSTGLTGLGMGGSIQYSGISTLELALGGGVDTLFVLSTAANTTSSVTLGAGPSTVIVQGADNTTHAIAGGLQGT